MFLYYTLDTMYRCYRTCLPHPQCSHSVPWPLTQPWTISPQILVVIWTCGENCHKYLWWFVWNPPQVVVVICTCGKTRYKNHHICFSQWLIKLHMKENHVAGYIGHKAKSEVLYKVDLNRNTCIHVVIEADMTRNLNNNGAMFTYDSFSI